MPVAQFCYVLFLFGVVAAFEDCIRRGGICMQESLCQENVEQRGLCLTEGEECCNNGPEPRCFKLGGECYSDCIPKFIKTEAEDCADGLECCVWNY